MAVVWPSKNNFANGDVLTAANMNNIADTLNVFNPTSATNGQVWVANGSGSGSFATPVSGGWTLINSGTLSGSTITSSSFSGYQQIHIDIINAVHSTAANLQVRVNGLSTNIYGTWNLTNTSSTAMSINQSTSDNAFTTNALALSTTDPYSARIDIYNANVATGFKVLTCDTKTKSASAQRNAYANGYVDTAAALTTVTILIAGATWNSGNYYFYGLK